MDKKRKAIIATNQVSKMAIYQLGGYKQKILLEGKNRTLPVLITLHGGPGMPIPFSAGCRGLFPEYTDRFIMVYWDQLGCGINNYVIDDRFSVENYVDMTVDLIKELHKEFPGNQLILQGTSWGSLLAAKAAARVPELIDNVLVYGQIIKNLFFNEEVYKELGQARIPSKARQYLEQIQTTKRDFVPKQEDVKKMAAYIRKYTEGYQSRSGGKMPIGKFIKGLLTGPDYTFKDFVAIIKNGYMKNRSLWEQLIQIDIEDTLQNIKVPYRILQGGTDIVTCTKAVSVFVESSGNPNLSFKRIESNGHIPGTRGMDEIFAESLKTIR